MISLTAVMIHQDEEKRHKEHVDRVMARLRLEKDTWFVTKSSRFERNKF